MNTVLLIIKLIILIGFCTYASINDIIHGIISNRAVLFAILSGVLLDIICWLINPTVIAPQAINIGVITGISILLYITRVWAAGDCKMMFVVNLLFPYEFYDNDFFKIVPLLGILIFAFSSSFIYLIIDSIISMIQKKKATHISYKALVKATLFNWLFCSLFIYLINTIFLGIPFTERISNSWVLFFMDAFIVLIISSAGKLKHKFTLAIEILFTCIAFAITKNSPINKRTIIIIPLIILMTLLKVFINNYNYADIPINDLKKGMIISAGTCLLFQNSRIRNLPEQSKEDLSSRLSEQEVEAIRKWFNKKMLSHITIVRKMPFAIFIAIGVMLTIGSSFYDH